MAGIKNWFYAVKWKVICLRIGAVGQNVQIWKVFNCIPEGNSLDIQKVVIAQWFVCIVLFKKQSMLGFLFLLVQKQLIRQSVCFICCTAVGLSSCLWLLQVCKPWTWQVHQAPFFLVTVLLQLGHRLCAGLDELQSFQVTFTATVVGYLA